MENLLAEAIRFHGRGDLTAARRLYRQILVNHPENSAALHLLGVIDHQNGQDDLAAVKISSAIRLDGDVAAYHSNLANVQLRQGQLDEACSSCLVALHLDPLFVEAHTTLGSVLGKLGKTDEALLAHRRAILCRPDHPASLCNLALALNQARLYEEATLASRRGLRLAPGHGVLLANLGDALQLQSRFPEALEVYEAALRLNPRHVEAHSNRGNSLRALGQFEAAEASYRSALGLDPGFADGFSNFAILRRDLGRLNEAITYLRRAIQIRPDYVQAHNNLGNMLMLTGDYEQGWAELEWRWRLGVFPFLPRKFTGPLWQGEDPANRTILVHSEQGMGDCLQFSRYLPLLQQRSARVIFEVPRAMTELLQGLPGCDQIIAKGAAPSAYVWQIPLLSLPRLLAPTISDIPSPTILPPPSAERRQHWREILPEGSFRVGVAWQGSPNYLADRERSLALAAFAPLCQIEGVRVISLQTGFGADQLTQQPEGMNVASLGADFDSGPQAFLDCAAVMAELDLVITVDTAIGHLAGILGRPVWLVLSSVPHWPWGLSGQRTPWYPSMRLYRQKSRDDWTSAFIAMAEDLRRLVAGKTSADGG